jgi:hypothetical protein
MTIETGKAQYETPELTVHGTFEALTQSLGAGSQIDKDFPAHTKVKDLTFS